MNITKKITSFLIMALVTVTAAAQEKKYDDENLGFAEVIVTATSSKPDCVDSSGILLHEGRHLLKVTVDEPHEVYSYRCNSDSTITKIDDPTGYTMAILEELFGQEDPYVPEMEVGPCLMDIRAEEIPMFYIGQGYDLETDVGFESYTCKPLDTGGYDLVLVSES